MKNNDMNNPGVEHPIQLPPAGGQPAAPSLDDVLQPGKQRPRSVAAGTIFGAVVGLLMGAVVAAACCWLTGRYNAFEQSVWIGALAGPFLGAVIGFLERKIRGDFVRPDSATLVCVIFSLLPALLLALLILSAARGRLSVLLGAIFAGPMLGLLLGGILDRAFEEGLKKAWGAALTFAVLGVAGCVGLVFLMDALAYGPDPKEVTLETRSLLTAEWSKDPEAKGATIKTISLVRKDRTTYTGFADVTFAGQPERLILEVVVDGGWIEVRWTAQPREQ